MTATFNIWVGLPAWAQSTSYALGKIVSNASKAYLCIQSGTSASSGAGPTLTLSSIIDNTVIWQYLSNIDYTGATGDVALANGYAALPSTFTQNVIWNIWNTGIPITTSAAGTYFINDGGKTIAPFYWTIQAAPGNSIRDKLKINSALFSYGNGSNGTSFLLPSTTPGLGINYFNFTSQNVIVSGLMFKDPITTSGCTIINFGTNSTLQYCILEGTTQGGGARMAQFNTNTTVKNCLIIDHMPAVAIGAASCMFVPSSNVYQTVFVSTQGVENLASCIDAGSISNPATIKNSMFFGWGNTTFAFATVSNCLFDIPVFPTQSGTTNSGGNLVGKPITAQFKNSNNDFRLVSTSAAINAGANLASVMPESDDMAFTHRPQQQNWDIGPWEYASMISRTNSMVFKLFLG